MKISRVLKKLAEAFDVHVLYVPMDNLTGVCLPGRRILINSRLKKRQRLQVLLNEIGHVASLYGLEDTEKKD